MSIALFFVLKFFKTAKTKLPLISVFVLISYNYVKCSFLFCSFSAYNNQLECGPNMPNVMAALPNIGGALCSTPQSLADAHNQSACSTAVTLSRRESR